MSNYLKSEAGVGEELDPCGNPVNNSIGGEPYGYMGEWYGGYINETHTNYLGIVIELMTFAKTQRELSELFQRPVDLVTRAGLKPVIREAVLDRVEIIYAA